MCYIDEKNASLTEIEFINTVNYLQSIWRALMKIHIHVATFKSVEIDAGFMPRFL